jgi:tRNA-binding protein
MIIEYSDFDKVDMRTGLVVAVEDFPRARTPTYKVQVDFGLNIGTKWSSVQAKNDYSVDELLGRQLLGVVNLAPKSIAGFLSEALLLGVPAEQGTLSLLVPSRPAKVGGRVY